MIEDKKDINELKIDDTYTTNSIIPLMPYLDPEWVLTAISSIKYLPSKTTFKVLLSAKKRDIVWYYVEIMDTLYKGDKGWINTLALMGDDIK